MADTDVNAESRSCERIENVQVDSRDADEEWVSLEWNGRGSEQEECISAEENYENAIEANNYDTSILTSSGQNDESNERPESQDDAVNEEVELLRAQSEESDDISVITDSEVEIDTPEDVLNVTFNGLCRFEGKLCGPLRMFEAPPKQSVQNGVLLNFIIACSLGVIIGLAVSKIFFIADTCSISKGIDIDTIRAESDNLINNMKDLNEVKRVLNQIKDSMPYHRKISRHQKKKFFQKHGRPTQPIKILDINSFHPTSTLLNQLQVSLNTLSSTIDEIDNVDVTYKLGLNRTQNILLDLRMFQNIMTTLAKQIQNVDKPVEARFLQSANDRIRRVSKSLLSELSETVYDMSIHMYNKFDNVRYKLNKRLCCLKSTLPNSENFLTELDKNNMFLNSCEKILDIKCNFPEGSNSKPRRKRHSAKTKQGTKKVKGEKASRVETKDFTVNLNAIKNEFTNSSRGFCSTNKSISPTIIGPLLPEDICPTEQTRRRSLYSEVVAGKIGPQTLNININDIQSNLLSHTELRNNTDAGATNTNSIDLVGKDTRESLNRNGTNLPNLQGLQDDNETANSSQKTLTAAESKQETNLKTPPSVDSIVEFLNLFDEAPEDTLNFVSKKKKKSHPSVVTGKKSKTKFKGSGKNCTKSKKGQKNASCKYSKSDLSATKDKRQTQEKNQQRHFDGDWQFKRSRSRECQRYSDVKTLEDPSSWYFNRARSRKNARDGVDFDDEFRKLDPNRCEWDTGSEEDFIDDWFEKKTTNSRKRSSAGQRFSMKNIVNTSHRRNILQTRRR